MSIELTLRHRLAEAGGWVDAADLRAGLGFSEAMVDDVLSDLVIHGMALFNARTLQYRLAVGPAARLAAQRLVRDQTQRNALVGRQTRDGSYLVGIAKRVDDGSVICAEVAFDYPGADAVARLAVHAWQET